MIKTVVVITPMKKYRLSLKTRMLDHGFFFLLVFSWKVAFFVSPGVGRPTNPVSAASRFWAGVLSKIPGRHWHYFDVLLLLPGRTDRHLPVTPLVRCTLRRLRRLSREDCCQLTMCVCVFFVRGAQRHGTPSRGNQHGKRDGKQPYDCVNSTVIFGKKITAIPIRTLKEMRIFLYRTTLYRKNLFFFPHSPLKKYFILRNIPAF